MFALAYALRRCGARGVIVQHMSGERVVAGNVRGVFCFSAYAAALSLYCAGCVQETGDVSEGSAAVIYDGSDVVDVTRASSVYNVSKSIGFVTYASQITCPTDRAQKCVLMAPETRESWLLSYLRRQYLGASNAGFCDAEFATDRMVPTGASGWLAFDDASRTQGSRTFVTNHHVIYDHETKTSVCKDVRVIFDLRKDTLTVDPRNSKQLLIAQENVFELDCTSILAQAEKRPDDLKPPYPNDYTVVDYAVVRLKRSAGQHRPGLKIETVHTSRRSADYTQLKEGFALIGHPLATPMKAAERVSILGAFGEEWFHANADHAAGSSGSPLINTETKKVEGMIAMIRLPFESEFTFDDDKGCLARTSLRTDAAWTHSRLTGFVHTRAFASAIPMPVTRGR
jgi:hypothetical protein